MTEPLSIEERLAEIEEVAERRWLAEFKKFSDDYDARVQKELGAYREFASTMALSLAEIDRKKSPGTSLRLQIYNPNGEPTVDESSIAELTELVRMGAHFKFMLDEIKRQPPLQDHWEQFAMLLQLSEDDDTQKYHRF